MRDLVTFVAAQQDISNKMYGRQRHAEAPVFEVDGALRRAQSNPLDVFAWADVIMAGIEGGLRAGATPFALCQTLVNRQTALANAKQPPHLAKQDFRLSGDHPPGLDEYGPETSHGA